MIKLQHIIGNILISVFCLCACVLAHAANDVCSTASIINPNGIDGGMGGTGITSDKGMGGTGITASGSMGGTGVDNGFGGTGMTASGGMGGTGVSAENGFGGTGLLPNDTQGGLAIIGVVTGFASICVNGEEVFYDKSTPVYDNGMAAKLSSLATGKMVMLKADKINGRLQARAIGLFDAVAGPVGRIDTAQNQMQVMGQTVRLNQSLLQQVKDLSPNANVRVSGHRLDSGEIVATRVDASVDSGKAGNASIIGLVTSVASNGVTVNGTRINFAHKHDVDKIKVGSEVRVNGDWNGSTMQANRVESQPIKNSINRADAAIIEGFIKAGRENTMRLGGTEIEASQGTATYSSFEKSRGKVVKIEMRRDNKGQWVCNKLEERTGKLFERHGAINSGLSSDDRLSSGNDDSGSSSASDNSGSGRGGAGANSGSGSSSGRGSESGNGRGSSSGSSSESNRGHGSSASGGGGRSSGSSSGGSGRGSVGGSSGGGSSGSGRGGGGKDK